MPVKSFFIPKESLQGAEIPGHIMWKDIPFTCIRAEIPPQLEIVELFNVPENCWKKESYGFVVSEVEVGGYLGMIMKSQMLNVETFDVWVDFSFVKEDKVVEKLTEKIHLFRPRILVDTVTKTLEVDVERRFVANQIKARNVGEGTAIVMVRTSKESHLKKKLPESIHEFRKKYVEDMVKNLLVVEKDYPNHRDVIIEYRDTVSALSKRRRVGKAYFKRMDTILGKLIRAFEGNEDFGRAFAGAVADAYLRNIQLITMFDNFLDYMNSVASKRVIIPDPLWVIPVSTEPKELSFEVLFTDLMLHDFKPIEIPKILIVGNSNGEIPIYRLFDWG